MVASRVYAVIPVAAGLALALLGPTGARAHARRLLGDVAFALVAHGPVLALGWAATSVVLARVAVRTAKRDHGQALAQLGLCAHVAGALLVAISRASPILGEGPGGQVAATIALVAVAAAAFNSALLTTRSSARWRVALDTVGLAVTAYLTAINLDGASSCSPGRRRP